MLKLVMTIEWVPPTLENIDERYIKNRDADITCQECGVLGGGTLKAVEARDLAREHDNDHSNKHEVKVIEVTCFF